MHSTGAESDTYADGTKLLSQCRHMLNTWSSVSEHAHGTSGSANIGKGHIEPTRGEAWRFRDDDPNPYQVEHDELFRAIREGSPYSRPGMPLH